MMYKDAGVDIDAGAELVKRLKLLSPDIGGFSGLYPFGDQYLAASTDGVGTKLKLAFQTDCHDKIGIDLVAMCVNDILVCGAKPLFFLDYFATSELDVDRAERVIQGIAAGCKEAGCALLGGETAEMPGFYRPKEYDLSGFAVGVVDKDKVIDGSGIIEGDKVIGIASSGVHSNGFSLVRKILTENPHPDSLIDELLRPTRIYVKQVLDLLDQYKIKGMAHITGGGLTDNLPRSLPEGLGVLIDKSLWKIPPVFDWLKEKGNVPEEDMFKTFNMGIGFALIADSESSLQICSHDDFFEIGAVIKGKGVRWA
jgi:phosphoribosylformylglycinamidine cyclo-ligase